MHGIDNVDLILEIISHNSRVKRIWGFFSCKLSLHYSFDLSCLGRPRHTTVNLHTKNVLYSLRTASKVAQSRLGNSLKKEHVLLLGFNLQLGLFLMYRAVLIDFSPH